MSSNDKRCQYRDAAMAAFHLQESHDEAGYKEAFDVLTQQLSDILPQGKLYRYRSNLNWKYSAPIIEKNEVYLCPLDKQNDPFEFAFNDDFGEIAKQVPALMSGTDIMALNHALVFQDKWKQICDDFLSYKARMSIACFCEEKDNILLWAHYANSNKGFCIEYSASDLLQYFQCFLLPVIYQESLPTLPSADEIDTLSSYRLAFERISTKSRMWSYENEWRVIKQCAAKDERFVNFPKPTAIYLGTNTSTISENRLQELCVTKKIPLYKMRPARYSYSLNEESIYTPPKGAHR